MPDVQELWGRFDETSAALVLAKRALREGRATEDDVLRLRIELMELGSDLSVRGEWPDPTEPGN